MIDYAYWCAGIIGLDPKPYSLRRLVTMANARLETQIEITKAQTEFIGALFNDTFDSIKHKNPFRANVQIAKPKEVQDMENRVAMNALISYIANM